MEAGDVVLIGADNTVIIDEMYVYICDHPWKETNRIACVKIKNTADTPKSWVFLKKDADYTPIAKHENMNWVYEKRGFLEHLFNMPEFIEVLESLHKQDPDIKKEIRNKLKGRED